MKVFHIAGYKNERDEERIDGPSGADDWYDCPTIRRSIHNLLFDQKIEEKDIISISASNTGLRDTGSWEFHIFVRG